MVKTFALLDSGATISVFGDQVAKELGVEIEKGKEIYLGGVGGRIKGFIHDLKIKVARKIFLDRQEFFKRFKIVLEEKKNLLELW